MKIIFNKKPVWKPWGGGNQILMLLCAYLVRRGHTISYSLDNDADVIVIIDVKDASCTFTIKQLMDFKKRKNIKVIHRVNDNGSHRKNNTERSDESMILTNKMLADETIFISEWLRQYYSQRGLVINGSHVIQNATDRKLFYPDPSAIVRSHKDPIKIITHHWSSNMSKGFDIYDQLDRFCQDNPNVATFKFLGNYPDGLLKNCCKISPKPYKDIPPILMSEDVYVTSTQFESGGCHIVEGMACGLIPIVRIGGGGTEEYSKGYGLYYSDFEGLKKHILSLYENYELFLELRRKIRSDYVYDAREMCDNYFRIIRAC